MFLEEIEEKRRSRLKIIEEHVKNGVVFADEFIAYIDCGVTIGAGPHICKRAYLAAASDSTLCDDRAFYLYVVIYARILNNRILSDHT